MIRALYSKYVLFTIYIYTKNYKINEDETIEALSGETIVETPNKPKFYKLAASSGASFNASFKLIFYNAFIELIKLSICY